MNRVPSVKAKRKTVRIRKNGKHPVKGATINAPLDANLRRILRGQAQFRWLGPQLAAITPQYIEATLTGAMAGAHVQQWSLFDLMLKTWPELLACTRELIESVQRKKLIFEPYAEQDEKPSPSADEKMKVVSCAINRMEPDPTRDDSDINGTVENILDAWFRGIAVSEIVWTMIDDKQVGTIAAPKSTYAVDVTNYAFSNEGVLGLRTDKRGTPMGVWPYSTTSLQPTPSDLIPFPPNKFLIALHKCSAGGIVAGALLRPLAWWWCAANFSSDWLLNLAQVFGLPFRWANYDPNAPQATIDAVCNMLQNMGSAGWAAFPAGTTLEMISTSQQGSDHSPQGELLDRADRYARLLILGQTMTGTHGTTGKGGGQAFGEVEADVKHDRIEAAGDFACNVINQQLIPAILSLNYGETSERPRCKFLEDDQAGLVEAQRDKQLADMGLEIGVDHLRKKYDIPEPAEDEETVGGEKPQDQFGGFDFGQQSNDQQDDTPAAARYECERCHDTGIIGKQDGDFVDAIPCPICSGDMPGHKFHGNQYTDVNSLAERIEQAPDRRIRDVRKLNKEQLIELRDEIIRRKEADPQPKSFKWSTYPAGRTKWKAWSRRSAKRNQTLQDIKKLLSVSALSNREAVETGDAPGHPFRGNQYIRLGDTVMTPLGKGTVVGNDYDQAFVSTKSGVRLFKKSQLQKIPRDTSKFPSLLESEENRRRLALNSKIAKLNEIKDDAVFSMALSELAAAEVGDKPGHPFRGNQWKKPVHQFSDIIGLPKEGEIVHVEGSADGKFWGFTQAKVIDPFSNRHEIDFSRRDLTSRHLYDKQGHIVIPRMTVEYDRSKRGLPPLRFEAYHYQVKDIS